MTVNDMLSEARANMLAIKRSDLILEHSQIREWASQALAALPTDMVDSAAYSALKLTCISRREQRDAMRKQRDDLAADKKRLEIEHNRIAKRQEELAQELLDKEEDRRKYVDGYFLLAEALSVKHSDRLRWFIKHESNLGVHGTPDDLVAVREAISFYAYLDKKIETTLKSAKEGT